MFLKQILGGITVFLALFSYFPYIRDILSGKTKPHAFTWLIFFILTFIGFFIQITNGAGPGAWFNGVMIIVCGFIMISGFIKGRKEIVTVDWISLILAFIAICFWLIIKEPTLSITLVIIVDFFGLTPTIRKSYVHPYSETLITYFINIFRVFLAVFALDKISYLTASYHFYMIFANILVVVILITRRKKIL